MRSSSKRSARRLTVVACGVMFASTGTGPAVANDEAHRLAEKFAAEGARQSGPPAAASRGEAAAARKRASESRQLAQNRQIKDQQDQDQERQDQQRRDQAEILERARAEQDARIAEQMMAKAAEIVAAEQQRRAEAERQRMQELAEETARKLQEMAAASAAKQAALEDEIRALREVQAKLAAEIEARKTRDLAAAEAEREAEGRRLAEKLAKAREARLSTGVTTAPAAPLPVEPSAATPALDPSQSAPPQPAVPIGPATEIAARAADVEARLAVRSPTSPATTTVSVLLMIEPGDRGIRRHHKTADPILCIDQTCYVSEGADSAAKRLARSTAFGTINTLGRRAGACNERVTCVFRGVELGSEVANVQPIDLRLMRHDRREVKSARADHTCAVRSGKLDCAQPVHAASYRLWLVPEHVAREVGAGTLEAALADGLNGTRAAAGQ